MSVIAEDKVLNILNENSFPELLGATTCYVFDSGKYSNIMINVFLDEKTFRMDLFELRSKQFVGVELTIPEGGVVTQDLNDLVFQYIDSDKDSQYNAWGDATLKDDTYIEYKELECFVNIMQDLLKLGTECQCHFSINLKEVFKK